MLVFLIITCYHHRGHNDTKVTVKFQVNFSKIVYISDWSFKEATLIKQLGGGTEVQAGDEGLLYVTLINELTGAEESGTVCAEKGTFSRQAGRLMCQSMGFVVGEGFYSGIFPNYKYVTQ